MAQALTRACSDAEIPHYSPHGLRHRRLTLWYQSGVPARELAERAGHSRPSMSLDVHTHVMPTSEVAVERLLACFTDDGWPPVNRYSPARAASPPGITTILTIRSSSSVRCTAKSRSYATSPVSRQRATSCVRSGGWLTHQLTASYGIPRLFALTHVEASEVTSTFVGVTIVAAITTISDAVLGVIRLATYLRDPFRGLRRLHKPMPGRITMYRIPTTGSATHDLPQGADPRTWSWRAARPRRVQRPRT